MFLSNSIQLNDELKVFIPKFVEFSQKVNLIHTKLDLAKSLKSIFIFSSTDQSKEMVKYLFLIAHGDPNATSTSHQLAKSAETHLKSLGHEVKTIDLVKSGFDRCATSADFVKLPKPNERFDYAKLQQPIDEVSNLSKEILAQQKNLLWCDTLIVFSPIWFYHLPACLYAYIERVFTGGWAYNFNLPREKLPLYNKNCFIVATTGAPGPFYSHLKGVTALDALLYSTTFGINHCGFKVYRSQGIWEASHLSPEKLAAQCKLLNQAIVNLEKRPLLPFSDPAKPEGKDEIEVFAALPNIDL